MIKREVNAGEATTWMVNAFHNLLLLTLLSMKMKSGLLYLPTNLKIKLMLVRTDPRFLGKENYKKIVVCQSGFFTL